MKKMTKQINLFWFSKKKLYNIDIENFGDTLSKYIVEKLSNKQVIWQDPNNVNFFESFFTTTHLAIGSILHFGTRKCIIWGSGLIDSKSYAPDANYLAVRGKYTFRTLKERNLKIPEIFGDPGLLLPRFFNSKKTPTKILGIIPHYTEVGLIKEKFQNILSDEILIIDNRMTPDKVLNDILSCKNIISSSLHGLIVPMAYNIPSLWIKLSNNILGDGIKYYDFFSSVGIENYKPVELNLNKLNINEIVSYINRFKKITLVQNDLEEIQDNLVKVNPY